MAKNIKKFDGASEKNGYLLFKLERKMVNYLLPKIPSWIETQHLTLTTLIWSLLLIGSGILALSNTTWIGVIVILIIIQYLTDVLDGALGRYRNSGLEKWGFYMDHLLDYIFGMSILIVLGTLTAQWFHISLIMAIWGGVFISFILYYSISNVFKISMEHFSPTEIRIGLIFYFLMGWWWGLSFFVSTLPVLVMIVSIILLRHIFLIHQILWKEEKYWEKEK